MKKIAFFLVFLMPFLAMAQEARRELHLFIVADKKSPDIAQGMANAAQFYEGLFNKMYSFHLKKYSFGIDQADFLKQSLQSLQVRPQDVVVFVSLMHGFRKQEQKPSDVFPHLKFENTDYYLKEVFDGILSKNAQFSLFINESCNAVAIDNLPLPQVEEQVILSRWLTTAMKVGVMTKLEALIDKSSGHFAILASSPNEVAFIAQEGGVFSQAFAKNMDCVLKNAVEQKFSPEQTWQDLGYSLSSQTAINVQRAVVNRDISQADIDAGYNKQNPVFFGRVNDVEVKNKAQDQKNCPTLSQVKKQFLSKYQDEPNVVLLKTASGTYIKHGNFNDYLNSRNYSDAHYLIKESKESVIIVSELPEGGVPIENPCVFK